MSLLVILLFELMDGMEPSTPRALMEKHNSSAAHTHKQTRRLSPCINLQY